MNGDLNAIILYITLGLCQQIMDNSKHILAERYSKALWLNQVSGNVFAKTEEFWEVALSCSILTRFSILMTTLWATNTEPT